MVLSADRFSTRVRQLMFGLVVVGLVGYGDPVRADPIVITGGSVYQANGQQGNFPGFTLTGPDSSFVGILPIGGGICCVFNGGDLVTLDRTFTVGNLPGIPTAQMVNGTVYPSVFVSGGLSFTAVPFVAPPPDGAASVAFTTPFDMLGHISGFADFDQTIPLFSVQVTGSGTATLGATVLAADPDYIGQSLVYGFEAPAPVPEPASLFLLGTGFLGLISHSVRKRRASTASPRQN
jgi:hypothetical protein